MLAGFAVAGLQDPLNLPWLLVSSACLYAGGVVLNDYFDRDLDRIERPERPIPSGRVSPGGALGLGALFLMAGIACAGVVNVTALGVATSIAALVLLYDTWGKRVLLIATLNLGLCRALNLLLGMAAVPSTLAECWPLGLIPLTYIGAVTAVSRGEVHGGDTRTATAAVVAMSLALAGLSIVAAGSDHRWIAGAVLVVLAWRVLPPFLQVRRSGDPAHAREAVGRGVLSLVLVNAVIATAYAGPLYGAAVLATALAAGALARRFAVT